MNHLSIGEQLPLASRSPTSAPSPDRSIYKSGGASADKTYHPCESPLQSVMMDVGEVLADRHAPWASTLPTPESIGYLPDGPEPESWNPASPHLSANPENLLGGHSDSPSPSSVHFSSVNGTLSPSYNWQQQHANTIACTSVVPPHMSAHPHQLASGSTQPVTYRIFRAAIPGMNLDGATDLCPGCYAAPFPSVWTIELFGCIYCELWLPRSTMAQSEVFPYPDPTSAPAMPLDRPRSPSNFPFKTGPRKGKSPQTRGRRSAKALPPPVQEPRCCPISGSGNINLPCSHDSCSPPPNVALLSRHFQENEKWEQARQDAVASFSYENCGFYKLPIEIVWSIVDSYPRLDYSYMRSIRAEPSVYNHRFEVLRNLIGVSKSFRKTFADTYWETFEMALTYPRKRVPEHGQLELGKEFFRYVDRSEELQRLRITFYNVEGTAARIRSLTFRVDRDPLIMQLFVDCLLALPNLHTLEIPPTSHPLVTLFGNAFKPRPEFRSIRRLIAPAGAHPILQCLPNLEELVCTRGEKPHLLLTKVFQAYDSAHTVATFKSFELIGANWTDMVGKELLRCFPNIQKLAMRKPSVAHLEKLASLTEVSELELWVLSNIEPTLVKRLKAKATDILRKSNPRVVCKCDDPMDVDSGPPVGRDVKQELGVKLEEETKLVGCRCIPPKRVFRLKHLIRKHGHWGTPFWGSERVEEIEVLPLVD